MAKPKFNEVPEGAIPLDEYTQQLVDTGQTLANGVKQGIKSVEDTQTSDSINPDYNSPIDLVAGGIGAKLGNVVARDAGAILGNEVGSVGSYVNTLPNRYVPIPEANGILPSSNAGFVSSGVEAKNLLNTPGLDQKQMGAASQRMSREIAKQNHLNQGRQKFADGGAVLPEGAIPMEEFNNSPQGEESIAESSEIPQGAIPLEEYNEQKHGTVPELVKTALEGGIEGAAGAIGTGALRMLGDDPESMRTRAETNPMTSGAANVAGLAGSMMMGTGLGKALEVAGEAAVHGAQLIKAEGIGQKIAQGAVRGAAEMGLLETSNEVSNVIKQDPETSLQSAMVNVGLAGLMGGVGGGALASISPLWKASMDSKLGQFAEDFKGRAAQYVKDAHPSAAIADELNSHYANVKDSLERLALNPELDTRLVEDVIPKVTKSLEKFEKKFVSNIDGIDQVDMSKVLDNAHTKRGLSQFLEDTEKYKHQLEKIHTPIDMEPILKSSSLSAVKASLGEHTAGARLFDALVRNHIKDGMAEGTAGAIGATIGHKIGNASGIPGMAVVGAYIGTKALGPFFKQVLPSIIKPLLEKEGNGSGLKSAIDYATSIIKADSVLSRSAKSIFKSGAEVIPTHMIPKSKDIEKLDKKLEEMHANADPLVNHAEHIGHYLPDHATAMTNTAAKAAQYLNSIRPNTIAKQPLDGKVQLSSVQKANWDNALQIAQQPLIVLNKIKEGRITPQDIIHLKGVAPKLYDQMAKKVTTEMMDHISKGETIPYKTRIGLSLFLGQGLDTTLTPTGIASAQPSPQQGQQQGQMEKPKRGTANLNKMSMAYATPSQSRESHKQTAK